ncbi:MAG: acetate--CoA ligase family protein [SAR202 cluster bacterium]|nr:acetate--CoA ligase family protein [SAR202 cluster bacterium]
MNYWTDDQLKSIHLMLNPKSMAIVGATPRMQYGGRFLNAALRGKDKVTIYPVNPRYEEIQGLKSYPSVTDLPEAPDVVGIVIPYNNVLNVLQESYAKGTRAAVVISAGFSERGEQDRADLQSELTKFCRESGLRMSGPNCLGLANIKDGIWASSSSRGVAGLSGNIGLICQSGASAFGPFLVRAVDEKIGFSYIISTGNEADLDFCDFARYLIDDDSTDVIAGFVEGFKDGKKFLEVAKLALKKRKPIILIKIGKSQFGTRAAKSHTAALTGEDENYEAAFSQYGVIRVQDYDDLLQISNLFAQTGRLNSEGISVVSHSGGISSLTADMLGQAGLDLPELDAKSRDGINEVLQGRGWASNPSDVTGFANSESFPSIMDNMIAGDNMGCLVVASAGGEEQINQVIEARSRYLSAPEGQRKQLVYLWTGSRVEESTLQKLQEAKIPLFYTPDKLGYALKHLVDYHKRADYMAQNASDSTFELSAIQKESIEHVKSLSKSQLSEDESKKLIENWGVITPQRFLTQSSDEAVEAANELGFPVVLKVDSSEILHKTEAGVVRVNVKDDVEVRSVFNEIMESAKKVSNAKDINGVLVEEMVTGGIEVMAGLTVDEQLGPVILFGSGGTSVEVYKDVTRRMCPISKQDAFEMIDEVNASVLLKGFRGASPKDIEALAQLLVNLSQLGASLSEDVKELDLNPVMVLDKGKGVKAADALVIL